MRYTAASDTAPNLWTRRQLGLLGLGAAMHPLSALAIEPSVEADLRVKATKALLDAAPKAALSPERPTYHFHPPANWMNDPNGTLFYQGWHHLFYQLDPYSPRGGIKYWGHARSRDLVNWEHLPIALVPSTDKGETQIYSGGATIGPDGRPRLLYTSVGQRESQQWLAYPTDDSLFHWQKSPKNPVATMAINSPPLYSWRDPFPFREGGKTYMVCGGNMDHAKSGRGAVHLYEAQNPELTAWKDRGQIFTYDSPKALNCECPNLFRLGKKWVLLISPWGPVEYYIGELDLTASKFTIETQGVLDHGSSYASNISKDDQGQTIVWLWGQVGDPVPEADKTWTGILIMPRILTLDDNNILRQTPAPAFKTLRGTPVSLHNVALSATPTRLKGIAGDCLEIDALLDVGSASAVVLNVRESADGNNAFPLRYEPFTGTLMIGNVKQNIGTVKSLRLQIYLDKRAVEVYVQDGLSATFVKAPVTGLGLDLSAYAEGGKAELTSISAWPMKPAQFSLKHFA